MIAAALSAALGLVMLMHPAQEMFAELQWNEKTQRVEIAMRLSVLDEQSLVDQNAKAAQPIFKGIVSCLRFGSSEELKSSRPEKATQNAILAQYRWVGRQAEGAHVWCYLEYTPPENESGRVEKPTHVRCDLFDTNDKTSRRHNHEHAMPLYRFTVLSPHGPKAFSATRDKPVVEIQW